MKINIDCVIFDKCSILPALGDCVDCRFKIRHNKNVKEATIWFCPLCGLENHTWVKTNGKVDCINYHCGFFWDDWEKLWNFELFDKLKTYCKNKGDDDEKE